MGGRAVNWTEIVKKFPEANLLQSPEYGRMNELIGDKVITSDFGGKGYALMIVRDARRGRYLEIPCGPLADWKNIEELEKIFEKIKQIAKKERCVFVRIRPQLRATEENLRILANLGLRKSPMHLAAEHTVILNLEQNEANLLAEMRRQTRYEVRQAEKKGIRIEKSRSKEIFEEFHTVQLETAKRQGFVPPNLETLLAEREAFGDKITIYSAETADKEKIAYGLVIRSGKEADYYEAASTPLNRKMPGAYALLWRAILDAKAAGCSRFNLWGIAPANQPNHRYAGVTTFKTGFGGEIVEYVPAHDMVISKVKYLKNLIVETIRRKKRHL